MNVGRDSSLDSVIVDGRGRLFFTNPDGVMRLDRPGEQPRLLAKVPDGPGGLAIDALDRRTGPEDRGPLGRGFGLARADCECRAPLPPRLARSTRNGSPPVG